MTACVLDRKTPIARLEWQIKVAAERPSNYDGRVTVNASDLQQLIADAQGASMAEAERDAALAVIADVRELGQAMEAHATSHQYGVDIRYALIGEAAK